MTDLKFSLISQCHKKNLHIIFKKEKYIWSGII